MIGNSEFTVNWAVETVQKGMKLNGFEVESHQVTPLANSTEESGLLSEIWRLELTWKEKEGYEKLPKRLVLKIPHIGTLRATSEEAMEVMPIDLLKMIHKAECTFYGIFGKMNPQPIPVPYCYYAQEVGENNEAGILILEDVSDRALQQNVSQGLNMGKCQNFVEKLASFHAYCIKNPELLTHFVPQEKEHFQVFSTYFEVAQETAPEFCDELAVLLPKVQHLFSAEIMYEGMKANENESLPIVLLHGDPWTNNIFFRESNGQISDQIESIIDWQFTNPGSATIDLARFMICNCSPVFRRKHWEEILSHYYDSFVKYLGEKPSFSFENVKNCYKKQLGFAIVWFTVDCLTLLGGPAFQGQEGLAKAKIIIERLKCAIEDWLKFH